MQPTDVPKPSRWRPTAVVPLLSAIALLAGLIVVAAPPPATAATPKPVVVSLTWDDGRASQVGTVPLQAKYGFPATYYVNSPMIGSSSYYMTKPQLDTIAAGGNEIGGHTEHHVDLTSVSSTTAKTEVCADRDRIQSWYGPTSGISFAYPFGAYNANAEKIVASCGYSSARIVGGVAQPGQCDGCPPAESIPPVDKYAIASLESVQAGTTLADLQRQVDQAATAGGGWVVYVFHDLGASSDGYTIDPAVYSQFLGWLAGRSDVAVRTVGEVVAGVVPQPPPPPPPPPPPDGTVRNASLETDANADGVPDCWALGSAGTNTASWSRVKTAHSGTYAERVQITAWTSGDRKLVPALDSGTSNGGCAPSVDPAQRYRMTTWYTSTAPVNFVVFTRDAAGVWKYWTTGPAVPAVSAWTQASFEPGALPTGTTAVSFGLALGTVGTLTTDDYALVSLGVPPPPPPPPPPGTLLNASLEQDANGDGVPDCWTPAGYGTNSFSFQRVSPGHTGSVAEQLTMTARTSGDRKLLPTMDKGTAAGGCAPTVTAGTTYKVSAWYTSTAPTSFVTYYLDANGVWQYWQTSPGYAPTGTWTQVSFTTLPVPAGATAISFGLQLSSPGVLTTDDYGLTTGP